MQLDFWPNSVEDIEPMPPQKVGRLDFSLPPLCREISVDYKAIRPRMQGYKNNNNKKNSPLNIEPDILINLKCFFFIFIMQT